MVNSEVKIVLFCIPSGLQDLGISSLAAVCVKGKNQTLVRYGQIVSVKITEPNNLSKIITDGNIDYNKLIKEVPAIKNKQICLVGLNEDLKPSQDIFGFYETPRISILFQNGRITDLGRYFHQSYPGFIDEWMQTKIPQKPILTSAFEDLISGYHV